MYSIGNSIQYFVMAYMGKESLKKKPNSGEREIYNWLTLLYI